MPNRSDKTFPAGPPADADSLVEVGASLRAARLALGSELGEIAQSLRIKPAYLDALERGDAAALPQGPYALGFLKAYSLHLGLDPAPLTARLKAARRTAPAATVALPPPPAEGRRPAVAILVATVLLASGIYGGYRVIDGGAPPSEIVALPPELPPEPPVAATPPPPSPVVAAPAVSSPPAAPAADVTAAIAAERVEAPPAVRVAALDVDSAPPAEAVEATGEGRVVLLAHESSWVQVRSAARDYVRTRTLQPGERFVLPDRADLALWTGNAGGLELLLDGKSLGRAGELRAVVRDLSLTPESLRQRVPTPTP